MNTSEKLSALLVLGLSQWDISRETGVSQATISRIIAGNQQPMESTVTAVADLYKKAKRRKRSA